MAGERQDGPGCLGALLFAAPFVAGAAGEEYVVPTILGSVAVVGVVAVAEWVKSWNPWTRRRVRRFLGWTLAALVFVSAPAWAGMKDEAGAQYVALTILLAGLWLAYFIVKKVFRK